jgi:hypothetical protein
MKLDIVRRYRHNPILTKAEIPYPVETVHNAAVVKHRDEYIMLFRSHLRTGRSIIGLARSADGFHFGLYAGLDRPHSEIAPWSIWISYSPDLRFLGRITAHHEAGTISLG